MVGDAGRRPATGCGGAAAPWTAVREPYVGLSEAEPAPRKISAAAEDLEALVRAQWAAGEREGDSPSMSPSQSRIASIPDWLEAMRDWLPVLTTRSTKSNPVSP